MRFKKEHINRNGLKRSWAMAFLSLGFLMCGILFCTSLILHIADRNAALDVIYAVFAIAFALLGLNTTEKIKNLLSVKKDET